nr:MAG TPA: hypothetical protein [Bacteriophage sp.]
MWIAMFFNSPCTTQELIPMQKQPLKPLPLSVKPLL